MKGQSDRGSTAESPSGPGDQGSELPGPRSPGPWRIEPPLLAELWVRRPYQVFGPHSVGMAIWFDDAREKEAVAAFAENLVRALNMTPELSRQLFTVLPDPGDQGQSDP